MMLFCATFVWHPLQEIACKTQQLNLLSIALEPDFCNKRCAVWRDRQNSCSINGPLLLSVRILICLMVAIWTLNIILCGLFTWFFGYWQRNCCSTSLQSTTQRLITCLTCLLKFRMEYALGILKFGNNEEQTRENKYIGLCHMFAILWSSPDITTL